MIKGKVKINKANDTRYIYLPKDCGFINGQEVEIRNSGIGILNESSLKKYYNENKNMFKLMLNEMCAIRKNIWDNFFAMGEVVSNIMKLGDLNIDDDGIYFNNTEKIFYSAEPYGDIDGGFFSYFNYDIKSFNEELHGSSLSKKEIKEELINYMIIYFFKKQYEKLAEMSSNEEINMFAKYGFKNIEDVNYPDIVSTLYTNGIVQVWYNAEDFSYNPALNVTTMTNIDPFEDRPNIIVKSDKSS